MIAAAALCFGVFAYTATGLVLGRPVRVRSWRRPRPEVGARQTWLTQAGAALTPHQFWAASIGAGLVALAIGTLLTGAPVVAFVPALAVATLPRAWFARRRAARLRALHQAWPDALRDIGASIGAGRSLGAAIGELAGTGPEPLRGAFERFPATARMLGVAPALDLVKESLADPTSDRVIEVLILASERGGRIVQEILDDLVVATTKDIKVLEEIDTESLEMRINARAVLALPWFVLLALTFRGGAFRDFYQSGAGLLVVVAGGVLSAVGYAWIRRLGRTLDERRVFGGSRTGLAVQR
jgi:tight adherence protein B